MVNPMATAKSSGPRRGRVCKGHEIPYGTFTDGDEDSVLRKTYYYYGCRKDEDLPELPVDELEDVVVDPFTELHRKEVAAVLNAMLDTLGPREAKILRLRYGLDMGSERTLDEVGSYYGVSKERVRQIEAKALRKMKHPQRSDILLEAWLTPETTEDKRKKFEAQQKANREVFERQRQELLARTQKVQEQRELRRAGYESPAWAEHLAWTNPDLYNRLQRLTAENV